MTQLIKTFVDYISAISQASYSILQEKYADVIEDLNDFVVNRTKLEERFIDESFSHPRVYGSRAPNKVLEKFLAYLNSIPVVGFNSQAYDLNVMKGPLLKYLTQVGKLKYTIKRVNKLQCIQTNEFRFLDIINFIAPGFNYDKYLKAFGCSQQKGFFPYEYIDCLDRLAETQLPPHSSFYSSLKDSNISVEDYKYCKAVWAKENMKTLADFLRWYSFLDVQPFIEAIKKQSHIYKLKNIDMLKDAISLPGLAVRWKFNEVNTENFDIPLLSKGNQDLYNTVKQNLVGGPSIVFHRKHVKGETKIRGNEYGQGAKICDQIQGWDSNALYLWCMMQELPTGSPIHRHAENNFKPKFPEKFGRLAWGYLEYVSHYTGLTIQHMYNKGEKRVGQHGLPVDGFCEETNAVYQFHGCLFHGHKCSLTEGITINPLNGKSMEELHKETKKKKITSHL